MDGLGNDLVDMAALRVWAADEAQKRANTSTMTSEPCIDDAGVERQSICMRYYRNGRVVAERWVIGVDLAAI